MSREDGSVNLWSLEMCLADCEKTKELRIGTDFAVGMVVVKAFDDFVGVVFCVVDAMKRMVMMRAPVIAADPLNLGI